MPLDSVGKLGHARPCTHAMPTFAEVLDLWNRGLNTQEIARLLHARESVVYNMMARLTR